MPGLYFLCLVVAGMAFWSSRAVCAALALLLTGVYYWINPPLYVNIYEMNVILLQLVAFLAPVVVIPMMIKQIALQKQQTLETISALVKALDSRDSYTAAHSENVAAYALLLSQKLKLTKKECETIYIGGLLHDIGKIGIPEAVLNKRSRLTQEEFEKIKEHPVIGHNTLKHIGAFQNTGILEMILHHHERYDGNGYPHRLAGKDIPLYARIICVADCLDAMTSRRVYRERLDCDDVLREFEQHKGTQFDPDIVDALLDEPKIMAMLRDRHRPQSIRRAGPPRPEPIAPRAPLA
ncbi:HD-GYP domain-containing protein [Gordoniibacillus kamchatkensis]|uniref:HD-GYP domain-containing protein n=1 Tax=Gordoniibacillus kamchatkensis TaxID=1590651 RepID=UPI0006968527|nr:HD-GYP domain-containing protein [Paenibacillus sp. VKM B-2647]